MPRNMFPPDNHNHAACVAAALARAQAVCERRLVRFTPRRRQVLEIIAASHEAVGAYEILARMSDAPKTPVSRTPAPITVYRALDFLMAHGLVHRIASDNTYIACMTEHNGEPTLFLICSGCGTVGEIAGGPVLQAVANGADQQGFKVNQQLHEIVGTCRHCRER